MVHVTLFKILCLLFHTSSFHFLKITCAVNLNFVHVLCTCTQEFLCFKHSLLAYPPSGNDDQSALLQVASLYNFAGQILRELGFLEEVLLTVQLFSVTPLYTSSLALTYNKSTHQLQSSVY